MNQSILCNDDFCWDDAVSQVRFTALVGGAVVTCYLSMSYLERAGFGEKTSRAAVTYCEMIQFDIEEDAQKAIAEERLDESGAIYLT